MNQIVLPPQYVEPTTSVEQNAALLRSLGFEVDDEQDRPILAAQYCLVRNDGAEKWRCVNCNVRHEHYTVECIPRPWRGLQHALLGYWTHLGVTRPGDLTPVQRARMERMAPIFGRGRPLTPLAASHPRTAQALATPETDVVQGAEILGSLDVISPAKARYYAALINSRARRVLIRL